MEQKTFVFIKPDGVRRHLIGEIIKRFEEVGLVIEALEMVEPDEKLISQHYPLDDREYVMSLGHRDVSGMSAEEKEELYKKNCHIIQRLHDYIKSGPVVKMILGGREDTVAKVREIVGKTDPAASPKGTIRGDLGVDSFALADQEDRSVQNLVHASGTPEEAKREIALWFEG